MLYLFCICRGVPKFMKRSREPDYRGKNVFGVPPIVNVKRSGQPLPQSIQQAMRYLRGQCMGQVCRRVPLLICTSRSLPNTFVLSIWLTSEVTALDILQVSTLVSLNCRGSIRTLRWAIDYFCSLILESSNCKLSLYPCSSQSCSSQ